MLSERILKLPGFLYQIGNNYYYLGKWICKKCTDQAATDCVTMYQMCQILIFKSSVLTVISH